MSTPPWLRLTHPTEEQTATGIYGVVVGAAVMTAAHATTLRRQIAAVLVTLVVYWAAERYARIVAERLHAGHRPAWSTIRAQLAGGWEMITASVVPLLVLIVAYLATRRLVLAEYLSLTASTLLLCLIGWRIGARGRLTPAERLVSAVVAGTFGAAMAVLKALLH